MKEGFVGQAYAIFIVAGVWVGAGMFLVELSKSYVEDKGIISAAVVVVALIATIACIAYFRSLRGHDVKK